MYHLQSFCAIAVLFLNFHGSSGQGDCVPGPVRNLMVTTTGDLSWSRPDNVCSIENYLVTIQKEGSPNLLYYLATTTLDLSFLSICEVYGFSVIAVSIDHVQGLVSSITARTPPEGLDLTVDVLHAVQNDQDVELSWKMKTGVEHCVDSFRLVVWDEDTIIPTDIYVQDTSIVLHGVVPCMKYEYEIRAIIGAEEEGNPLFVNFTAEAVVTRPPTLSAISQGVTTVNITWNFQSYEENRCPIIQVIADSTPSFNVSFPIEDSSERPPFTMLLTDLKPSSIYLCRILVENSAGLSNPLSIAVQTLPQDDRRMQHNFLQKLHLHEYLQKRVH